MSGIDLRSAEFLPAMHTEATLPSTSVTKIQFSKEVNQITIGSETHKIKLYQAGPTAHGEVVSSSWSYMFIPAGNVLAVKVGRGATRAPALYIAAASGTPTVNIMVEEY